MPFVPTGIGRIAFPPTKASILGNSPLHSLCSPIGPSARGGLMTTLAVNHVLRCRLTSKNHLRSIMRQPAGARVMRCMVCGAEMRLTQSVPDETMLVPGFEHHTLVCPSCQDEEQRLVFVHHSASLSP